MRMLSLAIGALALAAAGAAAAKPPHGKAKAKPADQQTVEREPVGYGVGGCPPGLAKKTPACMPPGQARKQFEVGQRVPPQHSGLLGYQALPPDLRRQHGAAMDPYSRYIRDQHYIYRVDPVSMIVMSVLRAGA